MSATTDIDKIKIKIRDKDKDVSVVCSVVGGSDE